MLLGCIADDFTGATDLANNLVRAGMRVVQTIGVPTAPLDEPVDAVVVALKSRTIPPDEAVALSLDALEWLRAAGAKQIYFKVCSTFDSTDRGNIGPVTEALMKALDCRFSIACPAFPENQRTVFNGYLFVGAVPLNESGMRDHPLTPMNDANLVRVLQRQCASARVGLIDHRILRAGTDAVRARMTALQAEGVSIAIVDAIADTDLLTMGRAFAELPLLVAGSGVAIGLPQNHGLAPSAGAAWLPPAGGAAAIVSGSCSTASNAQVRHFIDSGGAAFAIDPMRIAEGERIVDAALAWGRRASRRSTGADLRDRRAGGRQGGSGEPRHRTGRPHRRGHAVGDRVRPRRGGRAPHGRCRRRDGRRLRTGARHREAAHRPPDRPGRAVVPRDGARGTRRRRARRAEIRQLRRHRLLLESVRAARRAAARPGRRRGTGERRAMNEAALRLEIARVGQSLFQRGYAHATAGNISVRLDDGFLITPTDACLGFLDPERLAKVDAEGRQLSGDPASKTLALHRRIYAAEPEAHCVIHTHSAHLVALTLTGVWRHDDILPPITPYFVMKVGHVPLIPYHPPGAAEVATLVAEAIADNRTRGRRLRAVMLERLGPNVWHSTPAAAMATLEELEETARLWLLSNSQARSLTEAQLEALRAAFGVDW